MYIPGNETGYKKGTRLDIFTLDEDEAGIGNKAALASAHPRLLQQQLLLQC
jgi:hypothetical protein